MGVFQHLEPESLKVCRYVCWQWSRTATPLLFHHVILSRLKSTQHLKEILSRNHLSSPIKVISFTSEPEDELGTVKLLTLITNPDNMLKIWSLPTSCAISQHQTIVVAKLTGLHSTDTRVPNLKELRIITPDIPYLLTRPFKNLRKIHIVAESVQLPSDFTFPLLEEFHLTWNTIGTNFLTDFLRRHGNLKQVHLTLIITISLTDALTDLISQVLQTGISDELVTLIIKDAKEEACGKSQIFLKNVYRQIVAKSNEESAKALNEEFATIFKLLEQAEEKRHRGALGAIWSAVQNPDVIIFSTEYQEGAHPWIGDKWGSVKEVVLY